MESIPEGSGDVVEDIVPVLRGMEIRNSAGTASSQDPLSSPQEAASSPYAADGRGRGAPPPQEVTTTATWGRVPTRMSAAQSIAFGLWTMDFDIPRKIAGILDNDLLKDPGRRHGVIALIKTCRTVYFWYFEMPSVLVLASGRVMPPLKCGKASSSLGHWEWHVWWSQWDGQAWLSYGRSGGWVPPSEMRCQIPQ